jgi:hypothetical protein
VIGTLSAPFSSARTWMRVALWTAATKRFTTIFGFCCCVVWLVSLAGCGSSHSMSNPPPPVQYTLTLMFVGPGTGHVTGSPGINCSQDCSVSVTAGTTVTLTAVSDHSSTYDTLSGDPGCSSLSIPLTGNTTCIVTFNPGPSVVSASASQVLLQRRNLDGSLSASTPFVMRGVVWSPASTTTNTYLGDPMNTTVRRPEFYKWYQTDIPLISTMGANTVRLPMDLGFDSTLAPQGWKILSALYAANITVVMTVDDGIADMSRITGAVNYYKNHPAILAFSLGNEWNANLYYGAASSIAQADQFTQQDALSIKSLDTNHLVVSSYGDIEENAGCPTPGCQLADAQSNINACPAVDVWSVNVYRGDNFGTLFQEWNSISTKPMFLGEFGIDAFNTTNPNANLPSGNIDEGDQANWDISLWNDLFQNLSGSNPQQVAIGGTLFEWDDEWWKCAPPLPTTLPTCGFPAGGFPDSFSNEAIFGVTDIGRTSREVYTVLQTAYSPQYVPGPRQISFTANSEGSIVQAPGFAAFYKSHTLLYNQQGEGGGGRGFNVAAVNPSTGELISYPGSLVEFDTWASRDTGTDMMNLIAFLNGLPNGTLFLIAVGDEAGLNVFPTEGNPCSFLPYSWVQQGLQALESLGSQQVQNYCYQYSWAMIAVKGQGVLSEQLSGSSIASAQATITVP